MTAVGDPNDLLSKLGVRGKVESLYVVVSFVGRESNSATTASVAYGGIFWETHLSPTCL